MENGWIDKVLYIGVGLIGGLALNRYLAPATDSAASAAASSGAAVNARPTSLHSVDSMQTTGGSGGSAPVVAGVKTDEKEIPASATEHPNERLKMVCVCVLVASCCVWDSTDRLLCGGVIRCWSSESAFD